MLDPPLSWRAGRLVAALFVAPAALAAPQRGDEDFTLDDTDGDLRTGTPHWADIDLGFDEQGFPRHAIMETGIVFSDVVVPGGSDRIVGDETGPYTVSADVVANLRPPISGATLHYRVNGGSFATLAMTSAGGDTYTGDIPGQASPAVIELYLSADDTGNPNQTVEYPTTIGVTLDGTYDTDEGRYDPAEATPEYLRFFVGVKQVKFSDDFPTATQGSWTTNSGSDWEIGTPSGLGDETGQGLQWTDPPSAATGSYVWGNNVTGSPYYDDTDVTDNWLRSPGVDLSGVGGTDKTYLLFKRWLTVDREDAPFDVSDRSEIRIMDDNSAWQPIWKNHRRIPHVDSQWVDVELDISALANGNSVLKVEWRLMPDGDEDGDTLGGWNIDDVELLSGPELGPARRDRPGPGDRRALAGALPERRPDRPGRHLELPGLAPRSRRSLRLRLQPLQRGRGDVLALVAPARSGAGYPLRTRSSSLPASARALITHWSELS